MPRVRVPDSMLRFECNQKGCCCHGWTINFKPPDLRKLITHLSEAELKDVLRGARYTRNEHHELEGFELRRVGEHRSCMFLDEDARCGLQVKHGVEALPTLCRAFPGLAIRTPELLHVTFDPICPEVLEQLDESDEAYEIVERDLPDDHHVTVRSRFAFDAPPVALGDAEIDFEVVRLIQRRCIALLNAREHSPLISLAAIHAGLLRLAKGAPLDTFEPVVDSDPVVYLRFFKQCLTAHDAQSMAAMFAQYRRFVHAVDLSEADWTGLPALLRYDDDWPTRIDVGSPELSPLVFRYLAHGFYAPFATNVRRTDLTHLHDGLAHHLATAIRYADGLAQWLPCDARTALKVGLGAAHFAGRRLILAPNSSFPWTDDAGKPLFGESDEPAPRPLS